MTELVSLNGELIPLEQAHVSVLDYGFLFGYGLYETLRAYDGRLFRLDAHLARLQSSAQKLGIPLDTPGLKAAVLGLVDANGYNQTRVRITVSIGPGTMTPNLSSCGNPTVLVMAGEYHPYSPEKYAQGFSTVVSRIRRNHRSPVTYLKSANSMENMMARQEARDRGADEALFFNGRGYLTEASGSNIFVVKEGIVTTPRNAAGILPGITRTAVLQIAKDNALITRERNVADQGLFDADEVFATNSLIEVMPVTSVDGKPIADGRPGVVTAQLMMSYRSLVRRGLGEQ